MAALFADLPGAADHYQPLTCFGAYVLDTRTGEITAIVAKKTVLATGGLGQIFLHTTNQPGSVGHGVAMAYRVGARLIDLEFVQFHPTVFTKKNAPHFLVTEALRGEGGVLVNARGERFMDAAHPQGSLAPRDIVARAIHQELAASGEPCVFLDLTAMTPGFIRERFPNIHERCLARHYGGELVALTVVEVDDRQLLARGLNQVDEARAKLERALAGFRREGVPVKPLVKISHRISYVRPICRRLTRLGLRIIHISGIVDFLCNWFLKETIQEKLGKP